MFIVYPLLFGFVAALFVALPEFAEKQKKQPITIGLITFVLAVLLNVVVMYFVMPPFTHILADGFPWLFLGDALIGVVVSGIFAYANSDEYRGDSKGRAIKIVVILWLVLFVGYNLIAEFFISPALMFDNNGNSQMAALLNVQTAPEGQGHSDNDMSKLIKVTPSNALLRASRALPDNLGSYLGINRAYMQEVQGHPYFIVDLKVNDWRAFNSQGGTIPGYISVDATDPYKDPEFHGGYAMKYVPGGPWNDELNRFVYMNFLLGSPWQIDDLDGLEVMDDWSPIYTGTLMRQVIGWKGFRPDGVLTVDPQTGKITSYHLGEQPQWINRIYSQGYVEQMASWWGKYFAHQDWPPQGEAGVRKIDRVNDVFGPNGRLQYQVTMTSAGADQALTDILTIDALTGVALRQTIKSATVQGVENMIEERSKRDTAEGYDAQECELHTILQESVWYCIVVGKGGSKSASAGGLNGFAFVLVSNSVQANTASVILEDTLDQAYVSLRNQIAQGNAENPDIGKTRKTVQIVGTLDRKGLIVIDNKTYVLFTLKGKDAAGVTFRVIASNKTAALMQPGDTITVTTVEVVHDNDTDVVTITDAQLAQ